MPLEKVKLNRNTQKRKLAKLKLRYNKYVNIYIGKKLTKDIERIFFEKEPRVDDGSITLHYSGNPYLSAILRDIGICKSTSEAIGAGWQKKAETGFTLLFLDGLKNITHWNWKSAVPREINLDTLSSEEYETVHQRYKEYHNPKGTRPHNICILKEKIEVKPNLKI